MGAETAQVYDLHLEASGVEEGQSQHEVSPQVEDGHVRIANELFDAALRFPFTLRQYKAFMAILRKTYGYNKKSDDISSTQVAEVTGMDRSDASKAIKDLVAIGVITAQPGRYGQILSPVKDYSKWDSSAGKSPRGKSPAVRANHPQPCGQITRNPAGKSPHTKDNPNNQPQKTMGGAQDAPSKKSDRITFDTLPEGVSEYAAREWVAHRKKLRKPPTQTALDRAMKKAANAGVQLGISPDEAIYTAIEAGWQGLEVEWIANRISRSGPQAGPNLKEF